MRTAVLVLAMALSRAHAAELTGVVTEVGDGDSLTLANGQIRIASAWSTLTRLSSSSPSARSRARRCGKCAC
jgi:hypothetical protein